MEWLKRQFDAASRYADLGQFGIAPQRGFASAEEGNAITEGEQRRQLLVACAETIWSGA